MIKKLLNEKVTQEGVLQTGVKEVQLVRLEKPMAKTFGLLPPSICLIAQGSKSISFGDKTITYDGGNFLLGSVKAPVQGEMKNISKENPYLGLAISIDASVVSDLLRDYDQFKEVDSHIKATGLLTSAKLTDEIKEPIVRLLKIIGNPMDEHFLAPQILREIYYQVLKSDAGAYLKNCAVQHSKAHQIAPVIHFLEHHLQEEITIDDLAKQSGMSTSSLHDSFKKTTGLPPMQYLKRLRLGNAHNLLLHGNNVSEAALSSGYNSSTQFSREFKRLFGLNPSQVA